MDDNKQLVRTSTRSWKEMVEKAWGKEWTKPDTVYEFGNGRKFEDSHEGPYSQD